MKKIVLFVFYLVCAAGVSAQNDYLLKFKPGDKVETISNVSEMNAAPLLTLEAEVIVDSATDWTHLLSKVVGPTDRISMQYHQGKIYCIVSNGNNSYYYTTNSVISLGVKNHLTMVYNGSLSTKIKFFLNGVQQSLTMSTASLPTVTTTNTVPFKVGDGKFKGKIDEVRVWTAALSSTVINQWKDTTVNSSHPNYSSLKINWDFNDYQSIDTAHASQNTFYNGVITGAVYMLDSSSYISPPPVIPSDTIVGGYLPYYKIDNVTPDIFDYLTHVYYFSLGMNALGDLGRLDASGVFTNLASNPTINTDMITLLNWRGTKPVKIFVTVGGWVQSKYFGNAASNSVSRANLINNIKIFCLTYGIDGVDLDWEPYSGAIVDADYGLLINGLKTAFAGTNFQISATINPSSTSLADEFGNADFIQLMSYGANFGQNTQAPLSTLQNWVNGWVNSGYSKSKIVIGLPAFGRTPSNGTSVTYREIVKGYNPLPSRDTVTHNGYLYYYNGINTIHQKTQYAVDSNLRGVMIWELGQDTTVTDPMSLLHAVNDIIPVYQGIITYIEPIEQDEIQSLDLFPNPMHDGMSIRFVMNEPAKVAFSITDIQGQIIWSAEDYYGKGDQLIRVSFDNNKMGMYFLTMLAGNKFFHKKLLKL